MAKLITITALALLLTGCTGAKGIIAGNFCDVSQPHVHSEKVQNAMSDAELATETKHNEFGEKECGWKP